MIVEATVTLPVADADALALCKVGDWVKFWTKDDREFINVYARGSVGGQGLLGRMRKGQFAPLDVGWQTAKTTIVAIDGNRVTVDMVFDANASDVPPASSAVWIAPPLSDAS